MNMIIQIFSSLCKRLGFAPNMIVLGFLRSGHVPSSTISLLSSPTKRLPIPTRLLLFINYSIVLYYDWLPESRSHDTRNLPEFFPK